MVVARKFRRAFTGLPDLTGTLFDEKTHLFENIEWVYVFVPIHIALLTHQVSLSLQ
jgi:hypothetical protein